MEKSPAPVNTIVHWARADLVPHNETTELARLASGLGQISSKTTGPQYERLIWGTTHGFGLTLTRNHDQYSIYLIVNNETSIYRKSITDAPSHVALSWLATNVDFILQNFR